MHWSSSCPQRWVHCIVWLFLLRAQIDCYSRTGFILLRNLRDRRTNSSSFLSMRRHEQFTTRFWPLTSKRRRMVQQLSSISLLLYERLQIIHFYCVLAIRLRRPRSTLLNTFINTVTLEDTRLVKSATSVKNWKSLAILESIVRLPSSLKRISSVEKSLAGTFCRNKTCFRRPNLRGSEYFSRN
jgi:hypothetical protein